MKKPKKKKTRVYYKKRGRGKKTSSEEMKGRCVDIREKDKRNATLFGEEVVSRLPDNHWKKKGSGKEVATM